MPDSGLHKGPLEVIEICAEGCGLGSKDLVVGASTVEAKNLHRERRVVAVRFVQLLNEEVPSMRNPHSDLQHSCYEALTDRRE